MKTTATKEEATPALVPKLRFPEFVGAKGWNSGMLGDLSEVVRGGSPRPIDGFMTTSADGLNWLKIGDVDKEAKFVTQTAEKVRREALSKTRVVNPGDLILSNSMSFGRPYILQITTCIHDGWIAITKISKKTERDFLYYLISAPGSQSYFLDNAAGSGVLNLNADIIKNLRVCFPTPAEQQKIAECLSSVDELMAAQARKVDALKTHKKGLMQQLFPREGETQPRLRFPEFQNAGEWVETTLGSIGTFSSGGTPSKDNPDYWNGSIPWVSASSMYDLIVEKADHYVTPQAIGNGTRIAKNGSILILVRGSMLFKRVPICVAGLDVAFNQDVKALDVNASINTNFLLYQLSAFQSRFPINETGIGAGKIELDHLKGFPLFIPGPAEQQRIATCLSSLDALITAETQKHEALKTHKKGLMQQLFPSPEEVEA
jgi:type I restriction enzyme, S subunit